MTTGELLREGVEGLREAGSESARLDAELLLGDALGVGRTVVLAHPEAPVGADAAARFRAAIRRRATGEPVAYIRGVKEFFGLALAVDARALIPRPETERLVELAAAAVRRRLRTRAPSDLPITIVDVGTGSGAVAIALAASLRDLGVLETVRIMAVDESEAALELARENAVGHALGDLIEFGCADLLDAGGTAGGHGSREMPQLDGTRSAWPPFDLILANLPYVRTDALAGLPVAASFEPVGALDGGMDGLSIIERLLRQVPERLAPGGVALLEIGSDQGRLIRERCATVLPGWQCRVETDLAGLPRVAVISRG